ncbi:MAG: M20/M25/M40 family metallo-hydrolase, partial [Gammaproteobacteria bacterium]
MKRMNDSPTDLLRALINCKSVTPKQAGALDILQHKLAAAGFAVERMPSGEVDNLWAHYKNGDDGGDMPKLLFAGHVDVVPPGDIDKWQSAPFIAEERDGFIYGRGAADMKSAVAAMTIAAMRAAAGGYAGGLALLFTSDEEGAATQGTAHVVRKLQERGIRIKRCIVGEPTCEHYFGDTIKTGRRGSLSADINISGIQCHAAYPHRGDNPIPMLIAALAECQKQLAAFADGGGQFPP